MADTEPYCGQCGKPFDDVPVEGGRAGAASADGQPSGDAPAGGGHPACMIRAALEPPRFCPQCARRMVVQVEPMGWRAVCSRHGERRG
ncbi:MAG TPA: hypothetical protein VF612_00395 [Jatrophihabitans sp.]|jgi:hypothetical protein|uniref:biotin synthase auxiliary protein BsaP n=1 Tax=Jatrophihabitans sp. TaxID=1932789 RepID=UPI002F15F574